MSESLQTHRLQDARLPSLSIINSQGLFKLMSVESVMPVNHLILCHSLLIPSNFSSIRESVLSIFGGQSIAVSSSVSVLPKNSQDWMTLGSTGWISLKSNELSRIFFNITVQKHQFCTPFSYSPTPTPSSFTFIKRLFSSSSLSAIRVVSSAYLRSS